MNFLQNFFKRLPTRNWNFLYLEYRCPHRTQRDVSMIFPCDRDKTEELSSIAPQIFASSKFSLIFCSKVSAFQMLSTIGITWISFMPYYLITYDDVNNWVSKPLRHVLFYIISAMERCSRRILYPYQSFSHKSSTYQEE